MIALPVAGVAIESGQHKQEITLVASVALVAEPWRPLAKGEVLVVQNGSGLSPPKFGSSPPLQVERFA